jgi:RHS repeat-associated protein
MDRTQWLYDQATGLLTNKLYADGKGPAYSYTALGQLSTRIWARLGSTGQQLLTQYRYDSFGSLTNTAYSDGTPSVSFTINALGQMKTATDASGTRTIDYAADGQMLAEALAFNTSLFTLHEKYDTLGRNQGYALSNEVALITGTTQSYDLYGRLNQVTVDGITGAFTYGYLEGSHLQKTLAMPNGVKRNFNYEANRDLLTMIVHSNATQRLVQRDFTFDGLARLENRTLFRANETPVQPDAFGYNLRSELTNAVINANAFAYNFDPIGNRNSATEFGTNTSYIASALNQYTSITPVAPADNAFTPAFDLDSNQTLLKTTTGIWHVTHNAENRPILFSNNTTVVSMSYDYMGRRFEYRETVSGTLTRHERYLYRDYLQIAALDMLNSDNVKHTIAWDPTEPVATRPLALAIPAINNQQPATSYYYSFDQVKNVTELFDSTGAIAAIYGYSPFGQVTSALDAGISSCAVASNLITFSSEVYDSTLGLQYYNFRHYNPLEGRWANRDLINEDDNDNLFAYLWNESFGDYDSLGLQSINGRSIPRPPSAGRRDPAYARASENADAKMNELRALARGKRCSGIDKELLAEAEKAVKKSDVPEYRPSIPTSEDVQREMSRYNDTVVKASDLIGRIKGATPNNTCRPMEDIMPEALVPCNLRMRGKQPGPTIDPLTGFPVARFIVPPTNKGSPMIEPVGGSTCKYPDHKDNPPDTHTLYPNGSNYQRWNPKGTGHGHGHKMGTGPGREAQGPSIDTSGNEVKSNSKEAHWPLGGCNE